MVNNPSGLLSLEQSAATSCAQYCAQLVSTISGVQGRVAELHDLSGFGGLPSGEQLRTKYVDAANSLSAALGAHNQALNAMGNTFVAAGRLYDANDSDSATMFNKIKSSIPQTNTDDFPSSGAITTAMTNAVGNAPSLSDLGYHQALAVENSSIGGDTGVYPENPGAFMGGDGGWDFFFKMNMQTDPAPAAAASARWTWMSQQLTTAGGQFVSNLTKVSQSAWVGQGMNSAMQSVQEYQSALTQLTGSMNAIAQSLQYTSSWLSAMKAATPTTPFDPDPYVVPGEEAYVCEVCMPAYEGWYAPGIQTSASAVPVLQNPRWTGSLPQVAPPQTGPTSPSSPASSGATAPHQPAPTQQQAAAKPNAGLTGVTGATGPASMLSKLLGATAAKGPLGQVMQGMQLVNTVMSTISQIEQLTNGTTAATTAAIPSVTDPISPLSTTTGLGSTDGSLGSEGSLGSAASGSGLASADGSASQLGSAGSSALQTGQQAMQSGGQALQQAMQQGAQGAALPSALSRMNGAGASLAQQEAAAANKLRMGGGAGEGGFGGTPEMAAQAKLFPRAAVAEPELAAAEAESEMAAAERAGAAPMAGMPGGMGGAGAQGRKNEKEHRRAEYLVSTVHLDEAVKVPVAVKPVVEPKQR